MAVRVGIRAKIFSLALCLLVLTVVLSVFGTWQSEELKKQLVEESGRDIPLEEIILQLDEHALQRLVAFERWDAALDGAIPDAEAVQSASKSYREYDKSVAEDFAQAKAILDAVPASNPNAADLSRIRTLLDAIERDQALASLVQQRLVGAEKMEHHRIEKELRTVHETIQDNLQDEREEASERIGNLALQAARNSEQRERRVVAITSAVTIFAILFGLTFAWLVTKRMVRPVETLMQGVKSVEGGNLSVKIPVESTDEIGVLTTSFNGLVDELRAKEKLKETFGKYVDPRIVENVMLNPGSAEGEGGRRVMTISFCDLVGFTGISEDLTPSGLVKLLNRHFAHMAQAIHEHNGVVDKFIGDAVMAFWGPPFCSSADHAKLACVAALAQNELMEAFRRELPELTGLRKNIPRLDLRIGLASGDVIVGNIGSETTRSYTVIGDTVNLASRLEGANRLYGTQILMNREVRSLAGADVETREIDSIALKGKSESAVIHELLGLSGAVPEQRLKLRDSYEEGLAAYRKMDWAAASTALRRALELAPRDGASMFLLGRVEQFRAAPPQDGWDGVWRATEKVPHYSPSSITGASSGALEAITEAIG